MTCHNLAEYDPSKNYATASRQEPYAADFYMSLDDAELDNKLRLDFAWSILGNLVLEADASP
jgi:hypothetical protein